MLDRQSGTTVTDKAGNPRPPEKCGVLPLWKKVRTFPHPPCKSLDPFVPGSMARVSCDDNEYRMEHGKKPKVALPRNQPANFRVARTRVRLEQDHAVTADMYNNLRHIKPRFSFLSKPHRKQAASRFQHIARRRNSSSYQPVVHLPYTSNWKPTIKITTLPLALTTFTPWLPSRHNQFPITVSTTFMAC